MMTAEAREAWLAERQTYIGASEMAEAVGLSPWGDPISLWERKTGRAPERDESFRMVLGSLVEPIIGSLAEPKVREMLDAPKVKLVRPDGLGLKVVRHPDYPFIGSNPDFRIRGLGTARGLVQAKFRLDGIEFGEPDDAGAGEGIPLHYRIQGWGELLTTGADFVIFAVLDPRSGLAMYPLNRHAGSNADAIADLEADLVEYWRDYVEKDVPPPPSAKSTEALARRYPRASKVGKIASAGQEETLRALLDAVVAKNAAVAEWELRKNEVRAMIGTADYIEGAGKRFHWSNVGLGEDGEPKTKTIVEWEPIAKAYRSAIEEARFEPDPKVRSDVLQSFDLDAIESLYTRTETVEPSRRFTIGEIK